MVKPLVHVLSGGGSRVQLGGDPGLRGEEEPEPSARERPPPHRGQGVYIASGPSILSPGIIPSQWAPPPEETS